MIINSAVLISRYDYICASQLFSKQGFSQESVLLMLEMNLSHKGMDRNAVANQKYHLCCVTLSLLT